MGNADADLMGELAILLDAATTALQMLSEATFTTRAPPDNIDVASTDISATGHLPSATQLPGAKASSDKGPGAQGTSERACVEPACGLQDHELGGSSSCAKPTDMVQLRSCLLWCLRSASALVPERILSTVALPARAQHGAGPETLQSGSQTSRSQPSQDGETKTSDPGRMCTTLLLRFLVMFVVPRLDLCGLPVTDMTLQVGCAGIRTAQKAYRCELVHACSTYVVDACKVM